MGPMQYLKVSMGVLDSVMSYKYGCLYMSLS